MRFCLSIVDAGTQCSHAGCQHRARMLRLACILCLHSRPLYEQARPIYAALLPSAVQASERLLPQQQPPLPTKVIFNCICICDTAIC